MPNRSKLAAALFALPVLWAQTGGTAHTGNAVRLMQERRYAEAATEFEAALAADPNNDALRIQYATCLFAGERNDEARRQFETEQKRLGEKPGIAYYLGMLDLRASAYAAAIAKLKPLEANTAFPKASYYLGLAYLGAGQSAEAMAALERAARSNPHDSEVHYRLARVLTAAGRTDDAAREFALYRSAREEERFVEQEAPACLDALRAQPLDRARAICDKLADPNDSRRLLLVGQLYLRGDHYAEALAPLQQASRLDPGSFEVWHYLGLSLYGVQRYAEAVDALKKAAAMNPQFFDTVNLLAKALYASGDYQGALPVLERAHNLNPDDAQVAGVLERLRASLSGRKE